MIHSPDSLSIGVARIRRACKSAHTHQEGDRGGREREEEERKKGKMAVRTGVLKAVLGLMAICLAAYIVGPPLYWHLMEGLASASASCPSCNCECDAMPLLSIPQGISVRLNVFARSVSIFLFEVFICRFDNLGFGFPSLDAFMGDYLFAARVCFLVD